MSNNPLIEAAAAVLEGAGGSLQIVNLNKALFYFDLAMLRDTGRIFTGARYVAIDNGPVVDGYTVALVAELERRGVADQVIRSDGSKPMILRDGVLLAPDIDLLAAARQAGGWARSRSASFLSDLSHDNHGWRAAYERGAGTRINMILAMQQVVDVDPWLDAPLTDVERSRLASRDQEAF